MTNPLLDDWDTPFALPPFDKITDADFAPAFKVAFARARAAINAIANAPQPATFVNTIEALERAETLMDKVAGVFFNLVGADSTPTLEALQRKLSPEFAAFNSETMMNQRLFQRVDQLFSRRAQLDLTTEQARVLTLYHRMFLRAGAALTPADRKRLAKVTERLAVLGTAFSQNLLADERNWVLALAPDDLDGLPDFLLDAARAAADARDLNGHVITLSRSLIVPFLQFSPRRDLREKAFRAWVSRGATGGDTDNGEIVREILVLREERAHLLGYEDFATFKLAPKMAKTPAAAKDLLMAVWKPARAQAERDAEVLEKMMRQDGINAPLSAWDWRYYAEKRRLSEHALNEAELKPYFQLDQMIAAAFDCANRLFGVSFRPLDVPLYHKDARAWEVTKNGHHQAVFIGDYLARPSKRSGAWCSRFRPQSRLNGATGAITVNVCNFARAPEGQPNLLTFDDARTLFHEFGHALHSMLSDVTYPMISGTAVARDFVELPSQLFEHWLTVPEVLQKYALHADTGQPIPGALLKRLLAAQNFDQGFATVEYTASALVDLAFHSAPAPKDPMARQRQILSDLGLPAAIPMRHATPHFAHVFSGDGYSSGYYSYMWSEVMDADAFAAFEEAGDPFAPTLAARLERTIFAAGGRQEADQAYLAFRGRLPGVEALLKGRGLSAGEDG